MEIKVEFNNRHAEASTYNQLGILVAEGQQQWAEAGNYFLQALTNFAEYQDEHNTGMTLGNLADIWQTGAVPDLPQRVADVLGVSAEEVAALFAT